MATSDQLMSNSVTDNIAGWTDTDRVNDLLTQFSLFILKKKTTHPSDAVWAQSDVFKLFVLSKTQKPSIYTDMFSI